MTETSYSLLLRNLASDYYHNHMGFEDYRVQRKIILDNIDEEMNGKVMEDQHRDNDEDSSIFMQTIGFFKNKDIDK